MNNLCQLESREYYHHKWWSPLSLIVSLFAFFEGLPQSWSSSHKINKINKYANGNFLNATDSRYIFSNNIALITISLGEGLTWKANISSPWAHLKLQRCFRQQWNPFWDCSVVQRQSSRKLSCWMRRNNPFWVIRWGALSFSESDCGTVLLNLYPTFVASSPASSSLFYFDLN